MVYFVRHGESEANVRGVFAGQRDDSPLTATGAEQARAAATDIERRRLKIDRIVTSPLQRSHETAKIIAAAIGYDPAAIVVDPRVTEYDMGSMTGLSLHGVTSAELRQATDAEDMHAFHDRVMAALHEFAGQPGNTLVISHAGVARMIEAVLTHTPLHLFYDLDAYPHAVVTQLKLEAASR
jgi:probable phosphoglycerate mutase